MFAQGSPDFVHAYRITSTNNEMNDLFEDIVCRQLFSNDSERMNDFITLLVLGYVVQFYDISPKCSKDKVKPKT